MIKIKYNRFYFIIVSIIVFLFDQLTKYIIKNNYISLINKDLILFSIDYVKNFGAAFNLLSGSRIFLSTVSLLITIILIYIILNKKNTCIFELLAFSFILGGTIGNGFDRITKGYVIDFINLNFINFAVFNIADLSINIGLILIIYSYIKNKK